eukprot:snap_masked-scaffold_9-processed-gene-13.69-mRNA-1 protein AED:0.32 eAED:0.32 QI:0/0/0/0.5/1/1/2/0/529
MSDIDFEGCPEETADTLQQLAANITSLSLQSSLLQDTIDQLWILVTAIGVLSLQTGFSMLEAGTVQSKNVKSVLMKNASDLIFGTLVWYLIGFGIFQGDNRVFAGDGDFFLINAQQDKTVELFPFFVQQFGFAVTSVTIVSGCIMVAHLVFNPAGLFAKFGFKDFAGSGVVHLLGGVAGIVGAHKLGPRVDRFYGLDSEEPGAVRPIKPHSTVLIMLGGFLLYIGWFSFNAGSSLGLGPGNLEAASIAMINTLISAASGGASVMIYSTFVYKYHDVPLIVNGMLTGLVGITGPCAFVDTYAAVIIGSISGLTFIPASSTVLNKFRIDDPLDAFAVHGVGGFLGVIFTGIFDIEEGLVNGEFRLLGIQFICGLFMIIWSGIWAWFIFRTLDIFFGGIRVSDADQVIGLDIKYHNGYAYPVLDNTNALSVPLKNIATSPNRQVNAPTSGLVSKFPTQRDRKKDNYGRSELSGMTFSKPSALDSVVKSVSDVRTDFSEGIRKFKHLSVDEQSAKLNLRPPGPNAPSLHDDEF